MAVPPKVAPDTEEVTNPLFASFPSSVSLKHLFKQKYFASRGYGGGPQFSEKETLESQPQTKAELFEKKREAQARDKASDGSLKKKAYQGGFGYK